MEPGQGQGHESSRAWGRPIHLAAWAGLLGLFAAASWLRITSLDSLPVPDADEAWFAYQFAALLRGRAVEWVTPSGNPWTPLQGPVTVPLLLIFGPLPWIIRGASVVAGLVAIVLVDRLGTRMFGRAAGLAAAATLAALPFAVIQARTGYDCSQTPLYAILLLYAAYRAHTGAVVTLMLLCYYVHPTNLFLVPCAGVLYLARWVRLAREADPATTIAILAKRLAPRLAVLGVAAIGLGLHTLSRPLTQGSCALYKVGPRSEHDPVQFLAWTGRMFLATGRTARPWHDGLFAAAVLTLLVGGTIGLVRRRRWDALALVVGLGLSLVGLFAVGGSNILQPGMNRYGSFLIVPFAMAVGCLAIAFPWPRVAKAPGAVMLVAAAWALLLGFDLRAVDRSKTVDGNPTLDTAGTAESPWTLGSDRADAHRRAVRVITRDLARQDAPDAPTAPRAIICEDWWTYGVVRYLTAFRDDVVVRNFEEPGVRLALFDQLEAGGYIVSRAGGDLEGLVRSVYPDAEAYRRWELPHNGQVAGAVGRLDVLTNVLARPVPGDYDGDGTTELAIYEPAKASWTILDSQARHGDPIRLGPSRALSAPGDYDGDGTTDLAVYDPQSGAWHIAGSASGGKASVQPFGAPAAVPVPGDYDGDGKTDLAVFRSSTATWYVLRSREGPWTIPFGGPEVDRPVPGDYDGDGKTDLAVFRASDATFYVMRSQAGPWAVPFALGTPGASAPAVPVPGDYDGDGTTDLALYRADPKSGGRGTWHIRLSSTHAREPDVTRDAIMLAGADTDADNRGEAVLPVPGDYDGDGRTDPAVFRPSGAALSARRADAGRQRR